jgi:hypothetical protein
VYHLLDRLPPNRYVHPALIVEQRHIEAMQIDVAEEVGAIAAARPRFLILDPEYTRDDLLRLSTRHYLESHRRCAGTVIFERDGSPTRAGAADPR